MLRGKSQEDSASNKGMLGRLLTIAIIVAGLAVQPIAAQRPGDTLKEISATGSIRIGYRDASAPFSFVDERGQPAGYSIDLCLEIVEAIRNEISPATVAIEWLPVTPRTRMALIADGTIQLECGSTTNTLTRQQIVDFSHITFVTGTKLLVKGDAGIDGLPGMNGKILAVTVGTTNELVLKKEIERRGLDVQMLAVEDHDKGFLAVQQGRADAYATDHILLHGFISQSSSRQRYHVVGDFLSYEPYAIMLPRNDSAFRLAVNRRLSQLFRSGGIDEIYHRWFTPLHVPMTDLLRNAFIVQALPE